MEIINFCSKSTQTRIQGIKNTANLSSLDDLNCPVKVLDPENLLKSPKSEMKKYEEQLICTITRYQNIYGNYQKLKIRFHQLHSNHQKLLHVTAELTQFLENSLSGNPVNMLQVLKTCYTIFPDVFQKNLRTDSKVSVCNFYFNLKIIFLLFSFLWCFF